MIHNKKKSLNYENKLIKLDNKDNLFTSKKFYSIRKDSNKKKILKSLDSFALCLNNNTVMDIPEKKFEKVCFILINDNEKDLKVGPLHDGYLVGYNHNKLGYKVYYLYNSLYLEFVSYLWYFMENTTVSLTIFYTGKNRDCQGIEFSDGILTKSSIGEIISTHCNGKANILLITDSLNGNSVFGIEGGQNIVSLFVKKERIDDSKKNKRSHGIFTYYLCKLINDNPKITPNELEEQMNPLLERFNEVFASESTSRELLKNPIFK